MKKHDEHYQQAIEPIDVIENRVENPGEVPARAVYSIAQAIKYLLRAGLKSGQPWKKDVEKAINYLTRALTGDWVGEQITKVEAVNSPFVPIRTCPWCQQINGENGTLCIYCKRDLNAEVVTCDCGSLNDATRTTCWNCGTSILT